MPEKTNIQRVALWGDWGEATNLAADILAKACIPFRVCLTRDTDGIPVLSLSCGDIYGLDEIRDYARNYNPA